ncbi:MAG: ECF-type sigma factor [Holophagales bacterium]|nr:ECF-type sigma factor [Holophagales bacterium]
MLRAAKAGEPGALDRLTPTLYGQLRKLAGSYMRGERQGHTMQPTELVHEAFMRLTGNDPSQDRNHFIALSANTMRRVLVDHARQKHAVKRGAGGQQITLSTGVLTEDDQNIDVLDLDRALEKLSQVNAEAAKVIELRYFGGLTCEETAEVLGLSLTSVERRWRAGRRWLRHRLAQAPE